MIAGEPHADRVQADLASPGQLDEEEPVGEVDRRERDHRGHERHPEAVHLAEERAVELEPELEAPVGEQDDVDGERAAEVADEDAERALVPDDDEQDRQADRERDVDDAGEQVADRALLDAEERGQLVVVDLRPESDERGADEIRVRVVAEERVTQRPGDEESDHERRGGRRHREPEGRAHDARAVGLVLGIEVETEEGTRDPGAQHRHQHHRERDERLDRAVVPRREVPRVQRQQQDGEDPREEPAEAVDRRVLGEPLHLLEHQATAIVVPCL